MFLIKLNYKLPPSLQQAQKAGAQWLSLFQTGNYDSVVFMCAHLANMIIPIWLEDSNTSISSARSNKIWQSRADYKVQNWTVVMNCYDNWFLSFSLTFGWVLTGGWLSLLAHSPFGWVPCKVLSAWVGSHVPWGSPRSKVLFSVVNLK